MATNASFSPMSPQAQYPQPLQQQQQPAESNGALPAFLQQGQSANPSPNNLPGMTEMPGMSPESKLGNEQGAQQIALPQQANSDSFTFNKKEPTNPQAPTFGKKDKKEAKFGEDEDRKKEFAKAPAKSPFAPSFGEDEKKDKE